MLCVEKGPSHTTASSTTIMIMVFRDSPHPEHCSSKKPEMLSWTKYVLNPSPKWRAINKGFTVALFSGRRSFRICSLHAKGQDDQQLWASKC